MKLGIIGDFNSSCKSHTATNEAIEIIKPTLNFDLIYDWIPTNTINNQFERLTKECNYFWVAPGGPYKCRDGVLRIIEYARLNNIPTLGTCGGFQHMIIEFARNVLMIKDAEHAEYDPYAQKLIISPLICNIAGQKLEINIFDKQSKTYKIYGQDKVIENYYCNFGLNPEYQNKIHDKGFAIVANDKHNEARILELKGHKFFIATLFVPQANCSVGNPHKLIKEFLG